MPELQWIAQRAPGFAQLTPEQQAEVMHFPLLWSIFEVNSLNANGNPQVIIDTVARWQAAGVLQADRFADALAYFRNRYFGNRNPTFHFDFLYPPPYAPQAVVRDVLSGAVDAPLECVQTCLLVTNRYRNSFFHGPKIQWGFGDQADNFTMANRVLIAAIETEEVAP